MLRTMTTVFTLLATTTLADAPRVVADIPPVQAVVSALMEGVGQPKVIVDKSADPHHLAMRPSHAKALSNAELVVWVGPELTPWFEDWIASLAPEAGALALIDLPETVLVKIGEEETAHDEDHDDHEGEHEEDHDDHEGEHEEDHDDHEGEHEEDHDDHEGEHDDEGHEGHAHGNIDPHAWLAPANALVWADAIAQKLVQMDPENAAVYKDNLAVFRTSVMGAQTELAELAKVLHDVPMVAGHDSWGYLAQAFDLNIAGHLTDVEDAPASPRHLSELKETIETADVRCMIAEPGQDLRQVKAVFGDRSITIVPLSPMGSSQVQGTESYAEMLEGMIKPLLACAP